MTLLVEDGILSNENIRELQRVANALPVVYRYDFTFETAGLATGIDVYTPTVGQVLLDAWFDVAVAFDGTANADAGAYINGLGDGWFVYVSSTPVSLGSPGVTETIDGLGGLGFLQRRRLSDEVAASAGLKGIGSFATDHPVKLIVNEEGFASETPTPINCSEGAASLLLVVGTPMVLS